MTDTISKQVAARTGLPANKVNSTLKLLNEGATIPFIARYRKEVTGSLDELQIADIQREYKLAEELAKRKTSVLAAIEEQGKLSSELRRRIEQTQDSTELEDLYLPYKRKRKTRASVARDKGLEPLASQLLNQQHLNAEKAAAAFLSEEVPDLEAALQGARDIIAEWVNEDEKARNTVRAAFRREAVIHAKVARGKEEEGAKYRDYFDYQEPLKKCPSHRLLAIRRGEDEGFLRVQISPDEEQLIYRLEKAYAKGPGSAAKQVKEAVQDSYKRLLGPSIETEFRRLSKDQASEEAISVFATNLQQLLLAAPLGPKRTLGIDPGYRSGCKLVALDESGRLLQYTAIYPHPPQKDERGAAQTLRQWVEQFDIQAIAVGNGTAGRETLAFCEQLDLGRKLAIFAVNEAGASVYSASEIAREEFPNEDLTVRGAVSIARRLMDPLAEFVKIDPKSIGVGQYQHDVNQSQLKERLDQVVESCVNAVGINVNTASKHLLTYVSGLGPTLAQHIVDYRAEQGPFRARRQLMKVPRMGEKAFEQCAGFLRVPQGSHILDNTAVHPESYPIVEQMAKDLGCSLQELIQQPQLRKQVELSRYVNDKIGLPTLTDILKELEKPGLDPRGEARPFEFANIRSIADLSVGMIVPGIINNITNFGAFVDIGIKESGLVHVSQLANKFVKNPADVVRLQQEVMVKVMEIDIQRGRVQLSMKEVT